MSAKKDDDAALRSPTHAVPVDTLEEVHQSLNLIIIPLLIIAGFCSFALACGRQGADAR